MALAPSTTKPVATIDRIGTETLARCLLALLDHAGTEIDQDVEQAKTAIRNASSILRIELERWSPKREPQDALGGLRPWQTARVTAYIDSHLSERIPVETLGAVARRSKAHFCRAFKRTMGETPYNFIVRRRLAMAEHLMLTSDAPLSEVAAACGFSDQSHFCNRFREATGKSPSIWRRERQERSMSQALLAAE